MSDAGSNAGLFAASNRGRALRSVKCKYFKDLKEISASVTGDKCLMLKTDLESKIAADGLNHFSLMSDVLQRKDGKLVPLDTDQ